ncbi:MAG: DUF5060 domain-containing protein [bacterium]
MKRFFVSLSCIFILSGILVCNLSSTAVSADIFAQNKKLAVHSETVNTVTVGRYELFEITMDISATYQNPFDPAQIDVTAYFTTPSGLSITMPGFFTQDYASPATDSGRDLIIAQGTPKWKVRFTPTEIGEYKYFVDVRDKKGELKLPARTFTAGASTNPGFIRRSQKASHYLEFDSGKPYIGIGHSVGWPKSGSRKTTDYELYFKSLAAVGCNYSRIWMVSWGLALEWTNKGNKIGTFDGVGIYNLEHAARIDQVLNIAKDNGIYFELTLGSYSDLMDEKGPWNEQSWENNPYNKINGGFCNTPRDFFSNDEAKLYYKNRLRYVIARWGYSTNILSLEFFNEYKAPIPWVQEMGTFIKSHDPFGHLVTMSANYYPPSLVYPEDQLWNLDVIDYTQLHLYGYQGLPQDMTGTVVSEVNNKIINYSKPCIVAEFGIDSSKDDRMYDRQGTGVNIHNGIWGAIFAGSTAGTANWWWDSYIHLKNLYWVYPPMVKFASTVDWTKGNWNIARTTLPKKTLKAQEQGAVADMVIHTSSEWGATEGKEFEIRNNGDILGGKINMFLHAPIKKDIRITPVLKVDYPQNSKFIIRVGTISKRAILHIYLDDKEVWQKDFPTGEKGAGEWKDSKWQKQWKIWQSDYDADYSIDVPAGKHIIRLENTGSDWAIIKNITLTNYKSKNYAEARTVGLIRNDEAMLWIQNTNSNWYNSSKNIEPALQENVYFDLLGLPDGAYKLEWWDTWAGTIINQTEASSSGGNLTVNLAELKTDIAVKISKKAQ